MKHDFAPVSVWKRCKAVWTNTMSLIFELKSYKHKMHVGAHVIESLLKGSNNLSLGTGHYHVWKFNHPTQWGPNLFCQVQSPLDDGSLIMCKITSFSSLMSHNPTLFTLLPSCQRFGKHKTCKFLTTKICMPQTSRVTSILQTVSVFFIELTSFPWIETSALSCARRNNAESLWPRR